MNIKLTDITFDPKAANIRRHGTIFNVLSAFSLQKYLPKEKCSLALLNIYVDGQTFAACHDRARQPQTKRNVLCTREAVRVHPSLQAALSSALSVYLCVHQVKHTYLCQVEVGSFMTESIH